MENESLYELIGEAIGCGGGSIIYPAIRLIPAKGGLVSDGLSYALKECFPVSQQYQCQRTAQWEIVAETSDGERYLRYAQESMLQEGQITLKIFKKTAHMLPLREHSRKVCLTLPNAAPNWVANTVTVMDSLQGKGESLGSCLERRRRLSALDAFSVLQQVLLALRDVHDAGFLHLDIQDGNLFQDRSGMVTLIDFGSARQMIDGKTLPIEDQMIFSTEGFSAPEILYRNDGTLQLTVAADLYSVGCLGLLLLTGSRPDQNLLYTNTTGRYLKPNEVRRLKCPRHLIDKVQDILARALENEPEHRYQSADDMLRDVNDLLVALQPRRSVLQGLVYDAYICYKHGELDSAVALELQRQLEQFREPGWRRRKPFRRVFVDKTEMSSADLEEQEEEALKNSEWLIVLCSPNTPQSTHVPKEIDIFLKYHDRSRILAILTEGTHSSSLPQQLLGENGKSSILAADIRGADQKEVLKKLRRDGLLQLAAPMLDLPFDGLKQRQKLFKTQRAIAVIAAGLAAAIAFSLYAVDRNHRIQTQYRQSQINESLFLAAQAQKQLESNNPLDAVEIALRALPSGNGDRPLVPQAQFQLTQAVGAYRSPSAASYSVSQVGRLDTTYDDFFLAGDYLFTWGRSQYGIEVWDAESLCKVQELLPDEEIYYTSKDLVYEDSLIVHLVGAEIRSVNITTGEVNWVYQELDIKGPWLINDGLWVLSGKDAPIFAYSNQPVALTMTLLEPATGAIIRQIHTEIDPGRCLLDIETRLVFSESSPWAAFPAAENNPRDVFWEEDWIYLVNLENGAVSSIPFGGNVTCLQFTGNDLAVLGRTDYTMVMNMGQTVTEVVHPCLIKVGLYAPDGSQLWQCETSSNESSSVADRLDLVPFDTGISSGDGLLATFSNRSQLFELETGAILSEWDLHGSAITVDCKNNGFRTINADGSISYASFDTPLVVHTLSFDGPVSTACLGHDAYYLQNELTFKKDKRIRIFKDEQYDGNYTQLFDAGSQGWEVCAYANTESGQRSLLYKDDQLCLADLDSGEKIVWDFARNGRRVLGTSQDLSRIYWAESVYYDSQHWIQGDAYYQMDLSTGVIREIPQPAAPNGRLNADTVRFDQECLLFNASLTQLDESGQMSSTSQAYMWDMNTGTLTLLSELPMGNRFHLGKSLVVTGDALWYAIGDIVSASPQKLVYLDRTSGDQRILDAQVPPVKDESWNSQCYCWNEAGTRAVFAYHGNLYLVSSQKTTEISISKWFDKNTALLCTRFSPDGESVYALSGNGLLIAFRASDGECLGQLDLSEYANFHFNTDEQYWKTIDSQTLALFSKYEAFILDVSGEAPILLAYINEGFDYDPQQDCFIVADMGMSNSAQNTTIGRFPRYHVQDLVDIGNHLLHRP